MIHLLLWRGLTALTCPHTLSSYVISHPAAMPPLTCVPVHSTHLPGGWVRHPPSARGPFVLRVQAGAIIPVGPVHSAGQQTVCCHPGFLHVSLQQFLLRGENESSWDGGRPRPGPAEPDPGLNSQRLHKLTEIQTTQPASSTRQRNVFLGSVSARPPPSLPPPVLCQVSLYTDFTTTNTPPTARCTCCTLTHRRPLSRASKE